MGGPEANPPWEVIRKKVRSSSSLIAIYGKKESAKVHNELGMAWVNHTPCFAIVDTAASYDLGIAGIVLSFAKVCFDQENEFKVAVRKISRLIVKQNAQLLNEIKIARNTLFRKLRREPTVSEISAYLGITHELISQLVPAERSVDVYGNYGQYSRLRQMNGDLCDCWKSLGWGQLSIQGTHQLRRTYLTAKLRRGRWSCRFYFMVFADTTAHGLLWWRNKISEDYIDREEWPVIVQVSYSKYAGGEFRSFMKTWGGDYAFLLDIEPGIHYFGPGRGFENVISGTRAGKISYLMSPTFILHTVQNRQVLLERLKSLIEWISQNRMTVFPRPIIRKN